VPLSKLQGEILLLLASHRNPESYVAGATALHQDGPRFSGDIDIFHDREEAVAQASSADTTLLAENGFGIQWLRREPGIHAAIVQRRGESTKLEWVRDSDFRFFPTVKDDLFGYRLHVADLATNKALASAATVRNHLHQIAERTEAELGEEQGIFIDGCPRDWAALPCPPPPLTVGIEG
jgi:hypothetical protein